MLTYQVTCIVLNTLYGQVTPRAAAQLVKKHEPAFAHSFEVSCNLHGALMKAVEASENLLEDLG